MAVRFYLSYYNVIHAGGYDSSDNREMNEILQFNPESGEWLKIGALKNKRYYHAVSVLNFNSIKDFCL